MSKKEKVIENIDNAGESSHDNTLDNLLGSNLLAFECLIDLLEMTRKIDQEVGCDLLYALEKGFKDAMKDMRVTMGTLDRAYKLVPTGHKYTPDKNAESCENCGKKHDRQDMIQLQDMRGVFHCNECGAELKSWADTHQKEA